MEKNVEKSGATLLTSPVEGHKILCHVYETVSTNNNETI